MIIQLNAEKKITLKEDLRSSLTSLVSEELKRFEDHITRLEVHLSDENGDKVGLKDKRCMIEARFVGIQPIAVTENEATFEKAVKGAIEKLKTSLDKILGRLRNY